jgi:acetoacetyl-CoA synthetase
MAIEQPDGDDTRIVLFVVLDGVLDEALDAAIRSALKTQASPRHVPGVIVQTPELPRTRSGKMTELAVADIVTGRTERDTSSLANPECLEWFRTWAVESRSA